MFQRARAAETHVFHNSYVLKSPPHILGSLSIWIA
jgi:hypothetical protein